jgi:hypothetical protein
VAVLAQPCSDPRRQVGVDDELHAGLARGSSRS